MRNLEEVWEESGVAGRNKKEVGGGEGKRKEGGGPRVPPTHPTTF